MGTCLTATLLWETLQRIPVRCLFSPTQLFLSRIETSQGPSKHLLTRSLKSLYPFLSEARDLSLSEVETAKIQRAERASAKDVKAKPNVINSPEATSCREKCSLSFRAIRAA